MRRLALATLLVLGVLLLAGYIAKRVLIDTATVPDRSQTQLELGELVVVQRIRGLADTVTSAHDKFVIEAYRHLVCRLPAGGYGTMEFDMSDERVDALVAAGRSALEAHLAERAEAAAQAKREK